MTPAEAVRRHRTPVAVATTLLLVYGLTLARDVTFWDAGEFIAAASSFGVPHPPGTPLYVMLLRVALLVLTPLGVPAAVATSLVSAVATAVACAIGAVVLERATGDRVGALAGGIAAGVMTSVWLNASETEVYAVSLALALLTVWAAERAGRYGSMRWTLLTGYLVVLAVPLHLSALLAAPAALYLVYGPDRPASLDASFRAVLLGAFVMGAFALGTMRPTGALGAVVLLVTAAVIGVRRNRTASSRRVDVTLGAAIVAATAASVLLVMLIRGQLDPAVNQGNPSTWEALANVVARRQYAVADLWPRQAPLWLQLGNLLHYADWQVALSLGPTIFPTPLRTAATLVFTAFAVYGAREHRRRDRRSFTAVALLLAAGTIGAVLYLNLKAGPSFGHGVLPDDAPHEARERDYFFVLGWWAWGIWAGYGGVAAARRHRLAPWLGLAAAAMPLLLNWRAVDRTRLPEAALPRATAEGMLLPLPSDAVLFVAGDNDSYPLWYAQQTLGMRRDVVVVTTPLLPADWYRDELARRYGLFSPDGVHTWEGRGAAMGEIAGRARAAGRPVAVSVSIPAEERALVGDAWLMRGAVYLAIPGGAARGAIALDTVYARRWVARLDSLTHGHAARPSTDGTSRYMLTLLECPGVALAQQRNGYVPTSIDSLAPRCNAR